MTNDDREPSALAELAKVAESVQRKYDEGRWVLSFDEYLELFAKDPVRYARDASRYVRDNPWQSIGIAAGVGLLLGLLIGRR